MNNGADSIGAEGWFKQTSKTEKGEKITLLFQRKSGETPRTIGQKFLDFFSGIKRAKNSITLAEAFKGIKNDSVTSFGKNNFNVNLIPEAINKLAPEKPEDLLHTPKPAQEVTHGNYTLKLKDM